MKPETCCEEVVHLLRVALQQLEDIKCALTTARVDLEQWEDVTKECEAGEMTKGGELCIAHGGMRVEGNLHRNYRFRMIDGLHNGPAFIVERRKP